MANAIPVNAQRMSSQAMPENTNPPMYSPVRQSIPRTCAKSHSTMDSSDLDGISHKYFSVDHGSVMLKIIHQESGLALGAGPNSKACRKGRIDRRAVY